MNKLIGVGAVLIVACATFFVFFGQYQQNYANKTVASTAISAKKTTTTTSSTPMRPTDLPQIARDDWRLVLVSPDHKIVTEVPEEQLTTLADGHIVDQRIVKSYEELTDAAKKDNIKLHLVSAFRSVAYQKQVFNERVTQLENQEQLNKEAATQKAKLTMTEPGYSEHHTGLAVDVVDENWLASNPNMVLDESYSSQPGAQWLQKNASRFGFVVRYPDGKQAITKITYEPWHLRYVGVKSAEYMTKHNLTLEEYLDLLEKWEGYEH